MIDFTASMEPVSRTPPIEEVLDEAIENYGVPAIFNSDYRAQFTSDEFTGVLEAF